MSQLINTIDALNQFIILSIICHLMIFVGLIVNLWSASLILSRRLQDFEETLNFTTFT